jgi:NADH-quinone oxidoreductase subunit I
LAIEDEDVRRPEGSVGPTGLGLLKGLGVTLKHLLRPAVTQRYPDVRPDLPPRTRGVIALKQENCTVCYKCSRECPDWCIYIDAHKETHQPASGGKARSVKVLDRFAIDYALCMYCGICVEVCPFDALFWSPEFEYAEYSLVNLVHEKDRLEEWTYTVPPPPPLEEGAEAPVKVREVPGDVEDEATPEAVETPVAASAPAPASAPRSATEPAPPATKQRAERKEVPLDQETFDRVLAELLAKGTSRRVAEGQARRAATVAARKKAEEGQPPE